MRRNRLEIRYLARGGHGDGVIELEAALAAHDTELSPVPTHPDDVAFWLYSSGSTGQPKAVIHQHRNVEAICETFGRAALDIQQTDTIFATSKLLHHAYALGNSLLFSVYFGASAVLMDGPPRPERLLSTLREQRPTVLFSVPALYAMFAEDPDSDGALSSVRMCVSASAPLPAQTFDRWLQRFGLEILDGVGSTEMFTTYCSNRPGRVVRGTTGFPVPGFELRLTDDTGRVLNGQAVGGLEVRGESRAVSYWHQQERVKHNMLGEWFATGDRCERRADGTYTYVGRIDDMFKVGGLWVSPVEIEEVLLERGSVNAVGVVEIAIENHPRIAAVVECVETAQADEKLASDLRALCKKRLRDYQYPNEVRFVDELPRTLTGKPQRFKLAELLRAPVEQLVLQEEMWLVSEVIQSLPVRLQVVFKAVFSRDTKKKGSPTAGYRLAAQQLGVSESRAKKLSLEANKRIRLAIERIEAGEWCDRWAESIELAASGAGATPEFLAHAEHCVTCRLGVAHLRRQAAVLPLPLIPAAEHVGAVPRHGTRREPSTSIHASI